jgi:hypothetical protein
MTPIRRRLALVGLVAAASASLLAQPAAAFHIGQTVDCGDAGTFTIKAQPNGAGFEAPPPGDVLLFEEGLRLALLKITIDGVVVFDQAAVGRANNALDEVTCTFTLANGVPFEVVGLLVAR